MYQVYFAYFPTWWNASFLDQHGYVDLFKMVKNCGEEPSGETSEETYFWLILLPLCYFFIQWGASTSADVWFVCLKRWFPDRRVCYIFLQQIFVKCTISGGFGKTRMDLLRGSSVKLKMSAISVMCIPVTRGFLWFLSLVLSASCEQTKVKTKLIFGKQNAAEKENWWESFSKEWQLWQNYCCCIPRGPNLLTVTSNA